MSNSDFNLTRTDLIKGSFRLLGIVNPSSVNMANAVECLNIVVRALDSEGRWLHAISNTETSLNSVAATRSYSPGTPPVGIKSDILDLETFDRFDGTSYIHLDILSKEESLATYWREGTGQPTAVYLERAAFSASNKIHLFPTPDGVYALRYMYRRRLYDFDLATDNPDVPQGGFDYLKKKLALELAPEFGQDARIQFLSAVTDNAMLVMKRANAQKSTPTRAATEFF